MMYKVVGIQEEAITNVVDSWRRNITNSWLPCALQRMLAVILSVNMYV